MAGSTETATEHAADNGHEHRSRWPLIAAIGAASLYLGVGLVFVGLDLVPSVVPVVLGGAGAVGLLAGLAGWANEAFIADYVRNRRDSDSDLYATTMILFLVSDVATFSAGFVYYASSGPGRGRRPTSRRCLARWWSSTRRCCWQAA